MATGNKIEVDINVGNLVNNPIQNGEKIRFKINENFNPLVFDNGEDVIDKEFVVPETTSVGGITGFKNGVFQNKFGDFNEVVNSIELFEYDNQKLYAVGGNFTNYTYNNITTNCNYFIILNFDGSPYKPTQIPYTEILDQGADDEVNVIKYHELNQSLIIGGKFDVNGTNITNLVEFDMVTQDLSSSMSTFDIRDSVGPTSFGITDLDIRQSIGTIYVVGGFGTIVSTLSKFIFAFNLDFDLASLTFYNNTKSMFTSNDVPKTIYVTQGGDTLLFIGGNIKATQGQTTKDNFIVLDVLGEFDTDFNTFDSTVYKITETNGSVYIGGQFTQYGNQTVNKIVNINKSGVLNTNFNPDFSPVAVLDIAVGELTRLYVSVTGIVNYNFANVDINSGQVSQKVSYDVQPNVISYDDTADVAVGGNFTEFSIPSSNLNDKQIPVSVQDNVVVRNAIYDNLTEFNTRNADLGYRYIKISNNIVRISKIIENQDDLFYVSNINDIEDTVEINITRNDSDINNIVRSVPIRADYIITSPVRSEWSTTDFEVGDITISKPRIADEQISQYLNISPILRDNSFEADVEYFNQLDFGGITPVINPSRLGKFTSVVSNTLLNNTNLANNRFIGFTHDGYKETETILLNGRKRAITNRLAIPFLISKVQNIEFRYKDGGNQNIINSNFANINPENATDYVSYLNMNNIGIEDFVDIDFRNNNDGVLDTVRVYNRESKCLYEPVEVIFKNSFGMLEIIDMIGNSIEDISVESSTIKRNNRDINGRIGLQPKHTNKVYNKTGERKWELNVGYIPDYVNSVLEDLIMSEEVWLKKDGVIIPVVMEENGFTKVTDIQDLNNYSFNFREDRKITE